MRWWGTNPNARSNGATCEPLQPFGHRPTRRRQPITPNNVGSVRGWKPLLCSHRPQTGHVSDGWARTVKLSSTDIIGRTPIQPARPPTAALSPKPPAPSAPSSKLHAHALAVLETAGHRHITYRLSVTRGCPFLGLLSMKSITFCHAPQPPPPTLR